MTSFRVERFPFNALAVEKWGARDPRHVNWPVVYALDNRAEVYVGETLSATGRMRQHLANPEKQELTRVQVVVDETFNKSACLDLESFLIRLFAGDGQLTVVNRNIGITDSDYFRRDDYRTTFNEVFEELRSRGYFSRSIPEIENNDLFKLSPFKALTEDQAIAVIDILEGLFADLGQGAKSTIVVQGDPGTGKTVLAIFLMKLLRDIAEYDGATDIEPDSHFSEFFVPGYPELLDGLKVGLVVPQQSLRRSIKNVFKTVPGLDENMVMTPFEVGESEERWDLLIVDEAHRLTQRAAQAQAHGTLTKKFGEINKKLFGPRGDLRSQLDWIQHQSDHQIYLLDPDQSVRPADLPRQRFEELRSAAETSARWYRLQTQMRVKAGSDYPRFVKTLLRGEIPKPQDFGDYDLRFFDNVDEMVQAVGAREREVGLSRLVAGYAWPWLSRKPDGPAFDIALGRQRLPWNSTPTDWINSANSINEVGSIHTVQGYDLNYAGVIIGGDLVLDASTGRTKFRRERYFDRRGVASNRTWLRRDYTDDEILAFVRNIYAVLLTRGILGTYVYVEDPQLRDHVREALGGAARSVPSALSTHIGDR